MSPDQSKSHYAAASRVPLIQSPSLRVPRPVDLPPDIHPLPENINAYFVYPYTVEPHVLNIESNRRTTIAAHAARHEAYLRAREDEKNRRKREALRRIAPGFEPRSAPLVPVKTGAALGQEQQQQQHEGGGDPTAAAAGAAGQDLPQRDVMDDLVDRLAALEDSH
ncbi:hypothetical protein DFH94DRAFT_692743 [Russula ochroleuca]|uniref:Uncharacterized protein n=1 Tax=Russula ochroleuca TaxID=152965 RepID=A0A9P5MWQ8_9AGAM|nr:hypothetical protein DFH94DRAFT_692743 [Russula ochroleuca]